MDRMLSDLTEISAFVAAQRRSGTDVAVLLQGQCDAIVSRITNLIPVCGSLHVMDATRLTVAVNAGPWTSPQRISIAASIGDWQQYASPSVADGKARCLQSCMTFELYCLDSELAACDTTHPAFLRLRHARVAVLAGVAHQCGITCPSEKTSGRITAVLFWLEKTVGVTGDEVTDVLFNIKREIKARSLDARYPHQHLQQYPADPNGMPEAMGGYAFPDGVPTPRTFTGFDSFCRMMRLRGPKAGSSPTDMEKRIVRSLRSELLDNVTGADADAAVEALLPPHRNPRRAASGALLALTDGRASEGLDESHKLPRDSPNTGEENHGGSAPDDTSVVAALEAELLGARGKGVVKQRPAAATPIGRPLKVRKCPAALTPSAPRGPATPSTPATAGAGPAGKTNFTTHYNGGQDQRAGRPENVPCVLGLRLPQ